MKLKLPAGRRDVLECKSHPQKASFTQVNVHLSPSGVTLFNFPVFPIYDLIDSGAAGSFMDDEVAKQLERSSGPHEGTHLRSGVGWKASGERKGGTDQALTRCIVTPITPRLTS